MSNSIIEVSIKQVEVFSIIASVFSIVLGILAIALSIVFYKMSEKSARNADLSSKNIEDSVNKLETLFDKLYSGTFDMMRETVSDMRKHVYSSGSDNLANKQITKEIEEKTSSAIHNLINEIKSSQKTDEELEKLISNVISKSKQAEMDIKIKIIKEKVLQYLKDNGAVLYENLQEDFIKRGIIEKKDVFLFQALLQLVNDSYIIDPFDEDDDGEKIIYYTSEIKLC